MAERSPTDRVTQRRLEDEPATPAEPAEEPAPPEGDPGADPLPGPVPAMTPGEESPAAPPGKPPLHLEGPSDVELRKRQDAWSVEKARHEARRRARRSEDSGEAESRS